MIKNHVINRAEIVSNRPTKKSIFILLIILFLSYSLCFGAMREDFNKYNSFSITSKENKSTDSKHTEEESYDNKWIVHMGFKDLEKPMRKNYKSYLLLGYEEFDNDGIDNSTSVNYTFYFGGIPDYTRIPIDLQPFLMRRSFITVGYTEYFFGSHDYNVEMIELDDILSFNLSIGKYFGHNKKTGCYISFRQTEFDYDDPYVLEDYDYFDFGIYYYVRPNIRLKGSISDESKQTDATYYGQRLGFIGDPPITAEVKVDEKEEIIKLQVDYLWGNIFKTIIGFRHKNEEYSIEYEIFNLNYYLKEEDDDSNSFFGVEWYLKKELTLGFLIDDKVDEYFLSYFFKRKINARITSKSDDSSSISQDSISFNLSLRF